MSNIELPTAPRFVVPFLLTGILLLLLQTAETLAGGVVNVLRYEHFTEFPEFWRLFGYALVHQSWTHMGLNLAALAMVYCLFAEQFFGWRLPLFYLLSAPLTALSLYWFDPSIAINMGFSAIIYGGLTAGAVLELCSYQQHRSRQRAAIGVLMILGAIAKSSYDLAFPTVGLSVVSHFAGVICGLVFGVLLHFMRYLTGSSAHTVH